MPNRRNDRVVAAVAGEDDDPKSWNALGDLAKDVQAVEAGQAEIEEQDVARSLLREGHDLQPIARFTDDCVSGTLEDVPETGAHDAMVFCQDDPCHQSLRTAFAYTNCGRKEGVRELVFARAGCCFAYRAGVRWRGGGCLGEPRRLGRNTGRAMTNRRGLTVLVVDDEPAARGAIASALTGPGVVVEFAGNAVEALRALDAATAPHDVVICDPSMPDADGLVLLRWLADRDRKPAVILINSGDRVLLESARRLGQSLGLSILGAMAKPLAIPSLIPLLEGVTRQDVPVPLVGSRELTTREVITSAPGPTRSGADTRSDVAGIASRFAHDAANPLFVILTLSAMLRDEDVKPEDVRTESAEIHRAASSLSAMIKSLRRRLSPDRGADYEPPDLDGTDPP